jgi:dynein heavy chain
MRETLSEISQTSSIQGINHVINSFQETLLSIDNLIPDTTFDNFTRPYINEKYEDKTCGMIVQK